MHRHGWYTQEKLRMCATCHFLLAALGRLAYTRPMAVNDTIFAAYALAALLIAGLCLATFVRARRVRKSLAAQERSTRA